MCKSSLGLVLSPAIYDLNSNLLWYPVLISYALRHHRMHSHQMFVLFCLAQVSKWHI